jgi:acyl-CoA reductase-like NAD-dependent aldehyde dehydrogenase
MPARVAVIKTWKLFVGGEFPRSESGRSLPVKGRGAVVAHVAHASRKDLRDAVEAARLAQPKWADLSAYHRGQILHRMAEMLEGRAAEFAAAIGATGKSSAARKEVAASIDRLVCFAGWADKFAQVAGTRNPVAGPYDNFTTPEPTGIVAVVCPDQPSLLGLISLIAAPLCVGNAVVAIASDANPLPGAVFGEVCATSDLPPGVLNILTGRRGELLEHLANHREVGALSAVRRSLKAEQVRLLQSGAAENVKRVHIAEIDSEGWLDAGRCEGPGMIEPFVEFKTVWHPSAP